jgi:broad specificity phosphatase PhoE
VTTVLIFLRHGRTPNNADARLQGQIDSPLDEVGREQARRAGRAIRNRWDVNRVITSSLRRTSQSAEEAGLAHLPSTVDDRWMEIDFGAYDDRRIGEVMETLGTAWADDIEFVPEGGESMGAMHRRVGKALDEMLPHDPDENIVIVTHATPIKSAMTWIMGGHAEMILRSWVNLGSVTTFAPGQDGLLLSEFNWRPPEGD